MNLRRNQVRLSSIGSIGRPCLVMVASEASRPSHEPKALGSEFPSARRYWYGFTDDAIRFT